MNYQETAKDLAQVSISCESCGNSFSYKHTLIGRGSHPDKFKAEMAALNALSTQIDRVKAGDYGLITEYKPCPQCSYVQSWMILAGRKRRGRKWGLALGAFSFLASIVAGLIIQSKLNIASMMPFIMCGVPVVVFFVVRALVMLLYQPNKGHEAPQQVKPPSITFIAPAH